MNQYYYWNHHHRQRDTKENSSRHPSSNCQYQHFQVPEESRNPYFYQQHSTNAWPGQRHLPPSPIKTTNSFDRYSSPLGTGSHSHDPRGSHQQTPAKNIFEGHYEHQHPNNTRYSFQRTAGVAATTAVEGNYCCPSPFPVTGDRPLDEPTEPYVASHHTVYCYDHPHPYSSWYAMSSNDPPYDPPYDPPSDGKPSPQDLSAPRFFESMDTSSPESLSVPLMAAAVAAAPESPPPPPPPVPAAAAKPKRPTRSKKPARRLVERGNHPHASPSEHELEQATTNRGKKAMTSWYERYNELVDFKNEYGNTSVPQQYSENHALGIWVNKQRMEMKAYLEEIKSSMTPRRIELLEQIQFEWAKPKGQAAWDEKFQELVEFKRQNGDCHVPTKHKQNRPLGRWVSTQRHMKKNYERGIKPKSLDHHEIQRRISLLDELGFAWKMVESPTYSSS